MTKLTLLSAFSLLLLTLAPMRLKAQDLMPGFVKVVTAQDTTYRNLSNDALWHDAVTIRFVDFRSAIKNNDEGMNKLVYTLERLKAEGYKLDRLMLIRTGSSPDGTYKNNQLVVEKRNNVLLDSLSRIVPIDAQQIEKRNMAEDYEGLRLLMLDSDYEYRQEVTDIIEAHRGQSIATKNALRQLRGGHVWTALMSDYFPLLRAARVMLFVTAPEQLRQEKDERRIITAQDTVPCMAVSLEQNSDVPVADIPFEPAGYQPMLNVKTNLLYEVAMVVPQYGYVPIPNITLEFLPRDGHISAAVEYMHAGYRSDRKNKTFIANTLLAEGRYYLKGDAAFTGHYLSAYVATGNFDIQFSATKCWENPAFGKTWSGGIGWGYVRRIGNSPWKWELNAAVGFVRAPFDNYHPSEDWAAEGGYYYNWHGNPADYVEQHQKLSYFGLTRLGVSISCDLPWFGWKKTGKEDRR